MDRPSQWEWPWKLLALVLFALPLQARAADDPSSIAKLSRVAYSAFECASFASEASRDDEAKRLFEFGLNAARRFVESFRAGAISHADLSANVPVLYFLRLAGPSTDFTVGVWWEATAKEANAKVFREDADAEKSAANDEYQVHNCDLIGR